MSDDGDHVDFSGGNFHGEVIGKQEHHHHYNFKRNKKWVIAVTSIGVAIALIASINEEWPSGRGIVSGRGEPTSAATLPTGKPIPLMKGGIPLYSCEQLAKVLKSCKITTGSGSWVTINRITDIRKVPFCRTDWDKFMAWQSKNAVPVNSNQMVINLQARTDSTLNVNGATFDVERLPPLKGDVLGCAGGEAHEMSMEVDLDKNPADIEHRCDYKPCNGFMNVANEPLAIHLSASTSDHYVKWKGFIHLIIDGTLYYLDLGQHSTSTINHLPSTSRYYDGRNEFGWTITP